MKVDLLKFYQNMAKNNRGVKLEDIWNYSDVEFETKHNFIQWLFPTDQKSRFNRSSPVLTQYDIEMLKNDAEVMKNFRTSLELFLPFYGLKLLKDNRVVFAENFKQKSHNWITPNNHNYKRISRILRFLTIFDFIEIKGSLVKVLDEIYRGNEETICENIYHIWKSM